MDSDTDTEDYDRSLSRAGIEDSDLDSDEVDMILAGIYFGDPVSEKVDGGCNSNSSVELQTAGTEDRSSNNGTNCSSQSSDEDSSAGSSEWPGDISQFEVIDSDGSSDGEYTRMMDRAYGISSSESAKSEGSDDDGDSDSSQSDGPIKLNIQRDLGERPIFNDGVLVTTDSKSDERDEWCINDADRMLGMSGGRSRYYSKKINCSNCDQEGHTWRHCPKPKKKRPCIKCSSMAHHERNCPNDICFRCMRMGHRLKDCHYKRGSRGPYDRCERCSMWGHNAEFCTDIWRQWHHTTDPYAPLVEAKLRPAKSLYCCNCGKKGHMAHSLFGMSHSKLHTSILHHQETRFGIPECTKDRMNEHIAPTLPFVARYGHPAGKGQRKAHKPKAEILAGRQRGRTSSCCMQDSGPSRNERWGKKAQPFAAGNSGRKKGKRQWLDDAGEPRDSPVNDDEYAPPEQFTPKKIKWSEPKHNPATNGHDDEAIHGKKKKKKKNKMKKNVEEEFEVDRVRFVPDEIVQASTPARGNMLHSNDQHHKGGKSIPRSHGAARGQRGGNRSFPQAGDSRVNGNDWQDRRSSFHGRTVYSPQTHAQYQPSPQAREQLHDSYENPGRFRDDKRSGDHPKHGRSGSWKKSNGSGRGRHMTSNGQVKVNATGGSRGFKMSDKASRIRSQNHY